MADISTIRAFYRDGKFRPFRIVTQSGEHISVRAFGELMVLKSRVHVGDREGQSLNMPENCISVPYSQIATVETIELA